MAHALASAFAENPEVVVIAVGMESAFNSIHRAAMLAAVQQSAPALLPMVQRGYRDGRPLHIVGAPEGTPPVMSQRRVRQGDPLGVLLFAHTLQPVLERVDAAFQEAPPVLCLGDMNVPASSRRPPACSGSCAWTTTESVALGSSCGCPSAASMVATRSWLPPRLPGSGSQLQLFVQCVPMLCAALQLSCYYLL